MKINMKNMQLLAGDGTATRGLDLIVKIGSTAIGGQKNAKISMKGNVIDTSTKTSGDWERKISGAKSWSGNCDGFVYVDDAGYDAAVDAFIASTEVDVVLSNAGNTLGFKGKALITGLDLDAPYDDAMTYDIEITGTGELSKVAPTV